MKKSILITLAFLSFFSMSFIAADEQLLSTSLRITILNELGNVEEGANVVLYKSEEDYDDGANAVDIGVTDKKGRVNFRNLEPIVYFVHAENGERNNYGAGIQTTPLTQGKMNRVNIVIE